MKLNRKMYDNGIDMVSIVLWLGFPDRCPSIKHQALAELYVSEVNVHVCTFSMHMYVLSTSIIII